MKLGNLSGKAMDLNNIGEIYRAKGNYPEALKRYEEAIKIDEKLHCVASFFELFIEWNELPALSDCSRVNSK